jgi:hypothetical protein
MDRVTSLVESLLGSPITWGVVAVVLGAIAVSGKFSVTVASILLVLAWVLATVGISRSAPLLQTPLALRIPLTMFFASLVGIGLYYVDAWIREKPPQTATPPSVTPSQTEAIVPAGPIPATPTVIPASFSLGVRSAYVYDGPGMLSLHMVGYKSMLGDTASPVFYLVNMFIVNKQSVPVTIEQYSLATGASAQGPWEDLLQISLLSSDLYALRAPPPEVTTLRYSSGLYHEVVTVKPEDMAHAVRLYPRPTLESQLLAPIAPHGTVGGWATFDLKDHTKRGLRSYFRIGVRDGAGNAASETVYLPRGLPKGKESDAQAGMIDKPGLVVDLSRFKIRYHSDPYPKTD